MKNKLMKLRGKIMYMQVVLVVLNYLLELKACFMI